MYSFDVFDTLITRTTATPRGIFALMQEELISNREYYDIPEYIRINFMDLRINAEVLARKVYQRGVIEDISLQMIYASLKKIGCLVDNNIDKLIKLEKDIEYKCSVGISDNINRVKELISLKNRVVLISDMYLDQDIIRRMLVKADPVFEGIKIYVSSEYKKTKGSSNLYWVVKNEEKVEFKDWIHIGDNILGDHKSPSRLGIKTEPYKYQPLTEIEKKIIEKHEKNAFVQLTIGTARITRIHYHLGKTASLGASLGGVILFPYVYWVIQESIRKGINRLYFIARDGYILKIMADIIIRRYGYPISTFYIFGSRRAWRMASFSETNHDVNKLLSWSHPNHIKNLTELAEVFQITEDELISFLPHKYSKVGRLSSSSVALIQKELAGNERFWRYLIKRHKKKRKEVLDYLKENINFSNENFAFVELAGSGYTQICLADIISDYYKKPIRTFFLKMDYIHSDVECEFYNFLPSNLYLNVIIEILCRAPHGQTIGYSLQGEKMVPVIEETEGKALQAHGIIDYIKGIEKFTEKYAEVIDSIGLYPINLTLLLEYMKYITHTPDKEILDFIGGMPNSVTGREKKVIEYAPKLSYKDITNLFLRRTYEPIETYYHGTALPYSVLRCSKRQLKYLEFCKKNHDGIIGKACRIKKNILEGKYEKNIKYKIPLELLKRKIIIYAAGNVGQSYYRQLKNSKKHKVILWVDEKWEEFRKLGLPVSNPLKIKDADYDQIIIAVSDKLIAESIKGVLLNYGVDEDKIIWL